MKLMNMLLLFLFSGQLFAAGAHSHGEGRLDVAAYGNKVEIHLKAPLSDVIGFEHKAKNQKQNNAIKEAMNSLSKASLFISAGKSCKVKTTKLSGLKPLLKNDKEHQCEDSKHHEHHEKHCKDLEHKKHHDGHDDHSDEHEKHMEKCKDSKHKKHHESQCKDENHDKHKEHGHHHGHHKETGHGDFEAEYQVECSGTSLKGRTLELKLKTVIPRLKKVRVQFVGGSKPVGGVKKVTDSMRFEL